MTNKDLIMELVNNLEVKSENAEIIAKILDCDIDGKVCDVVEVVRCKDCKHCTTDNGGGCNKENGGLMFATKTDFCSYGERETDD